ncbi:interferon-induced protein with tetratricopeptide repeats 5-like [Chanos chanos]|uniref:Interferon-induced protein with tetratricopeptide repeats 5-like n=1 Tax=Chanos chanos TaxID=29144 RepID=A0A6J2VFR6_CHACN|nr:interferon-induced protein with tetratricopeptide repeats 5-like [Chanos chanos]
MMFSFTSATQDRYFKTKLLQLECHFTWALRKDDADLTDVLNRLEEQIELDLGKKAGVARSYNLIAFVKYLLGSSQEALTYLQKSVELTKDYRGEDSERHLIVTYGDLAWLHYHTGDYTQCESYLGKLKDIREKFPTKSTSVHYPEVLGEKGWTFLKFSQKHYDKAKECFKKALEQEPDESEWNAGYAIALYRTETENSSPEESATIQQLRRAIETNQDDAVLKVFLALRLSVYKKFKEADDLVEKALEMSPDSPHVIRYVGKYFRNQGSLDRSIALLKRALDRTPNSAFIHHQLALCYKKKKNNLYYTGSHHSKGAEIRRVRDQCIYHLEMVVTLKSSFVTAMSDLALIYGENKEIQKAENLFQNVFKMIKEKNEPLQTLQIVRFHYAEFQQYSNRCEPLAIQYYMECLKLGTDTYDGKRGANNLRKIAERRISRNPKDGEAFGILGFIHKEKGEKCQAIECYEKALTFTDSDEFLSNLCELRLSLQ